MPKLREDLIPLVILHWWSEHYQYKPEPVKEVRAIHESNLRSNSYDEGTLWAWEQAALAWKDRISTKEYLTLLAQYHGISSEQAA